MAGGAEVIREEEDEANYAGRCSYKRLCTSTTDPTTKLGGKMRDGGARTTFGFYVRQSRPQ